MPTPEQVRERVETYAKAFSAGDKEGWLDCFADDAVQRDPVTAPANVGREAIGTFWDNVHALADEMTLDVHQIHVCGDEGVLIFTAINKMQGGGIQVDNIVDIFRIDDEGKIAEQRAYWDPSAMKPLA